MKQIEIKTTVYLLAVVPDDYEPSLAYSVEDDCASIWLRHSPLDNSALMAITTEGVEVIHEEDVLD